jgi:putative FmdB family regulatory protein
MPIYEYRCENGHTFEVMQKMTDPAVETCPEDGTPVQRVFHPVAVHFKGSGFYNTDYGKKKSGAAASSDGDSGSSGSDSSSSSSDSKSDSKKKTESTSSSSSSSSSSSD